MSCAMPKSSNSSGQSGLSLVPGQNNNPVVMVGPAGQRTQVTSLEQKYVNFQIYLVFLKTLRIGITKSFNEKII